jgi:hypothetical protein
MFNTILRRRNVALVAVAACALLSFAGLGIAQQPKHTDGSSPAPRFLNGTYGFSLTQTCVRTPFTPPPAQGIDPTTKQLRVNGEFVSGYGSGTLTFDRNGTVRLENGLITEISAAQIAVNQTPVTAGTQFGCDGDYTLQSDGKLNLVMVCETAPPQPGLRVVLEPIVFEGFVGRDRSINLGTYKRDIHTVTVLSGNTPVQQRQRMCLQSLNLDKR